MNLLKHTTSLLRASNFQVCLNNYWKKALMSCGSVREDSVTRSQDVRAVGSHTLANLCTVYKVGTLGERMLIRGYLQHRTPLRWEHWYPQYLSCAPLAFALDHYALQQHSGHQEDTDYMLLDYTPLWITHDLVVLGLPQCFWISVSCPFRAFNWSLFP